METKILKISEIKLNPNNPRLIKDDKFEKLVNSIKEFPEMLKIRPIVVNKDMIILGGNMRFKACKEAGLKEIPVIVANELTSDQEREFLIKDNVSGGEWDWNLLNDWDKDELDTWGLDIPNFETDEVLEAEEDDFDGNIPEEPITVLGDLYEIGEHRLLCGDSTDSDQVEKLMNGQKADMVFTDPPYNINVSSISFNTKIENDNLNENDFKDFIKSVISNLFLFCKGSKYICFDIREKSFINMFYENGMKSLIVWVKDIGQHHRENYGVKYELIAYFEDGEFYGQNEENVWECKSIQSAGSKDDNGNLWFKGGSKGLTLHPTQKPILIPTRAINNSSKINQLVLDLFGGSGSTMVASHQLKRKCYNMELDPKYCDVIIKRMIKLDPTLIIKRNGLITNEFE
jgi:DNA modification methylase